MRISAITPRAFYKGSSVLRGNYKEIEFDENDKVIEDNPVRVVRVPSDREPQKQQTPEDVLKVYRVTLKSLKLIEEIINGQRTEGEEKGLDRNG